LGGRTVATALHCAVRCDKSLIFYVILNSWSPRQLFFREDQLHVYIKCEGKPIETCTLLGEHKTET